MAVKGAYSLSICIPSYNREKFLPDLLASIVKQYDERVEIVICDNGSTDGTQLLVQKWQECYPRIIYERFPRNIGPDRCFLRSVELASSPFCWLMGDDDIIEEGGLLTVLRALEDTLTGISVNRIAYDYTLQQRWQEPSKKLRQDYLFTKASTCFLSLFTLFGFLSGQVIQRKKWLAVVAEEDVSLYYNAYVLVYIIGRMIQKDPCWLYLHTPCVGWRSGNDSFAQELGRYKRFTLDVIGYDSIVRALFKAQPDLCRQVMQQVCAIHFLGHVRDLKFHPGGKNHIFQGITLCFPRLYCYPIFWSQLLPVLLFPRWAAKMLRFFLRMFRSPFLFVKKE